MRRPLPLIPRGPRRIKPRSSQHFFAAPRIDPEWELGVLAALIKPQLGDRVRHRQGEQKWPRDWKERAHGIVTEFEAETGFRADVQFPKQGEYLLIAEFEASRIDLAKALVAALSLQFQDLWFVLDRLLVVNGAFYRRKRGYRMELVAATNVHLKRELRAAVQRITLAKEQ